MFHADTCANAWEVLAKGPFFALIVMEITLADGNGRAFLSNLRKHPYLKNHPVLVYSNAHDRETIHKTLEMGIQNYLFKPFEDEKLFAEIRKSIELPWWKRVFDPEQEVLQRFDDPPADSIASVHKELLRDLRKILESQQVELTPGLHNALVELRKNAEKAGFAALAGEVKKLLSSDHPTEIQLQIFCEECAAAARLLKESGFPKSVTEYEFSVGAEEKPSAQPAKPAMAERVPTGNEKDIFKQLDTLKGYPVIESVAASFQMAAANPEIEVETLAEMILADPCLSAEVYYHVNHVAELARKTEDGVREQKHAIQLLGLMRIRSMASGILFIPDEAMACGGFNWKQYRTFQVGCGILAELLVQMLSLQANPSTAYFAGLVHELGKILLVYLYPATYQKTITLAHEAKISLAAAEMQKFGCSSQKVGAYFAELSKFPPDYIDIIRFYSKPGDAPRDSAVMAAVISMADYLCQLHGVGFSGSRLSQGGAPLVQHPSWLVLQEHVGPMFSLNKFEREVADLTRRILLQLSGG